MKIKLNPLKKESSYDEKYLLSEIRLTKAALDAAYSNFEQALDPDLIDCYIYQINASQKRYKFLIERAKQIQLTGNNLHELMELTAIPEEEYV